MPWDGTGRIVHSLKRESIRRECEASLKRLKVDAIDLYQIHWNKPAEDVEEALTAVAELRDEGKVRYIGVSNFNVDEMRLAKRMAAPVCLQPPYSLIDRHIEREILPFCEENDIGVIVYSPMASGLLSGKMTRERIAHLSEDDLRRSKAEFQEPQLSRNLDIVERLRSLGERHNCSPAELAVAWTIHNRAVAGAIVGLRRPDQVDGIIGASEIRLSEDDLAFLATDTGLSTAR
jgi:aryl-alcohol dehydrogenase-like predicted oxidoreductase